MGENGKWPSAIAVICRRLSEPPFTKAFQLACNKAANIIMKKVRVVMRLPYGGSYYYAIKFQFYAFMVIVLLQNYLPKYFSFKRASNNFKFNINGFNIDLT